MKRVPVCFGDYRLRDRWCNGTKFTPPCLVRDRCSALKGLLSETNRKREEMLKANRNWAYVSPELVRTLDVRIAQLGILDGLERLAAAPRRKLPIVEPKPSSADLFRWFVQKLSEESRRSVVERKGQAEIGQLFWEYRKIGDWHDVYCRQTDMECPLICSVILKKRYSLIDVLVSKANFELTLNKKERSEVQVERLEEATIFKGLDRYRSSVVASRVARAINGGQMRMPYEAA